MRFRNEIIQIGLAIGCFIGSPVAAQISPAFVSDEIGLEYISGAYNEFGTTTGQCQYYGCSISVTNTYDNGNLSTNIHSTAEYPIGGAGFGALSGSSYFFFRVNGPVANEYVPLQLHASATTSVGDDSLARALIEVRDGGLLLSASSCQATSLPADYCDGVGPASFSGVYSFSEFVGNQDAVIEGWSINDFQLANLTIDPMITIDPEWSAQHPGYTISFSPNPAGVPEPATWAMMLVGFGGLGAAMRWRHRTPSAGDRFAF